MNLEWLLDAVSDADPCGPNLDEANDPAFVDYYFDAVSRLPERFIEVDSSPRALDVRFDPARVDLKRESGQIAALLRRSRDLRLVVLQAQWELLSNRLVAAADTIQAIPALIERWGDAVHPRLDVAPADRRAALAELASQPTVLQPLLHASLNGSDATLRLVLVADKVEKPRSYEAEVAGTNAAGRLAARDSRKEVVASHEALGRIATAARRVQELCQRHPSAPFSPELEPLRALAEQAMGVISAAVPELAPAPAPPPEAPREDEAADDAPAAEPGALADALPVGAPAGEEEARRLLVACERYFATLERSSPALILVRQALELWGRPLVEAMEILLPELSAAATIGFGPSGAFRIPIERMRVLSPPPSEAPADAGETEAPTFGGRAEVAAALRAIEAYFEAHEPSSPVPLLLRRARGLLDKTFEALMAELLPKPS